jgi:hypothetical protein
VYRALRSINPSPIYSFDYGDSKYLVLQSTNYCKRPKRNPSIAGTFKRTGDDEKTQY